MKILRNIALVALALFALFGVGSLVLTPTTVVGVDASGIPHGDDGHNHDEMTALLRERLRLQAEQNPELLAAITPATPEATVSPSSAPVVPAVEPKSKKNRGPGRATQGR